MKNIRVAASSVNQTPLAWDNNYNNIISVINKAQEQNVNILCLPELCITGYSLEDAFFSRDVQKRALKYLYKIIKYLNHNMIVSVGLPLLFNGALYNVTALIRNGQILGFVPKQNLANDGIHYETRWFKPWPQNTIQYIDNQTRIPIGDCIFEIDGIKIGIEICEDSWVAERTGSNLAKHGVDVILNPSASHFSFGKWETRKQLVLEGSRAFKCTYVYSNLLGNEAGRAIYGGDNLIASNGNLLASNNLFSFEDFGLTTAVIDIDHTKTAQIMNGSFRPILNNDNVVHMRGNLDNRNVIKTENDNKIEITHCFNKNEEFSRAVSLGLFDYMRKSNSKGFVVSLSGGADSSAVSCLVGLMKYWGEIWLGPRRFEAKAKTSTKMKNLLTCVWQGTENSSNSTYNCAGWLADDLGASFIDLDIGDIVSSYTNKISEAVGRELTWETDDITLQNIQARVRSPSVWMIANIKNAILLTTSNRSESAVGYCTLDGDSSGSLNPIGGIDKSFLLEWLGSSSLNCLDFTGKEDNAIGRIIKAKPTAELRPPSAQQADEKDLMPYNILNFIEKCAIRDKKMPLEVYLTLKDDSILEMYKLLTPHVVINNQTIKDWVRKFFTLWVRNQYKRERFAVSFHVDDESTDPKTWLRWPVLCASLQEELLEMEEYS